MFAAAPVGLALIMRPWMVFPAIWLLAFLCAVVLWRDRTFDRSELARVRGLGKALPGILLRCAVAATGLLLLLWATRPEWLFGLVRERPQLWALIMVFYPLLSAYPQEVAFRTYFRHRYRELFGGRWPYFIVCGAAFAWAHVIMHNVPAILLSFVGGVALAYGYEKHRSTLAAWLEHAIYGCTAFTIGWGRLFYAGAASV